MACPLCTACARCSAVDLPCHPAPTERAPAPVRHLHVPKTGTSFAYTLVAHRCGGVLPPEQLFAYLANVSRRGRQAYDLERALIDRARAACEIGRGTRSRIVCGGRLTLPLFGHTPVKRRGNATLVGFFRRPAQRLLSAFYHEKHAVGPSWQRARRDPMYAALNASAWARWPGIAGCQTKMLTGFHCGADVPLTDELVARAVGVLRTRFAFVGLTEEWPRSICLYHAAARSARPLEMEFANANPAHGAVGGATHDEALLEGFVDHADEAVYAAARELFEAHERRVRGGLAANLLGRAIDGNVGLKKPRRVIK